MAITRPIQLGKQNKDKETWRYWVAQKQGRIVGLDKAGNEVEHSYTDPEVYFEPIVEYGFKPKDKNKPDGPKVRAPLYASL